MKKLSTEEIEDWMSELQTDWKLSDNQDELSVSWSCKSFSRAMLLANSVAHIAEKVNHHPGIKVDYKTISFSLSTHDAGGLTSLDFRLARQIEVLKYEPKHYEW